MSNYRKMMVDMIGEGGYEKLSKAIYKQRSRSVVDPSEQLLGLLTAPRTILSWLIATIKPMKVGSYKDVKFPGRDDISIHFEKQDIDVYRAEFYSGGRLVHSFDNQSLPAVASHMVTTGELYEEDEEPAEKQSIESPKEEELSQLMSVPKIIMAENDIKPVSSDSESDKWMWAHANVKELTSTIGKLVDALVSKHVKAESMDKKELKGDEQKIDKDKSPEEIQKEKIKDIKSDPSIKEPATSLNEMQKIRYQDADKNKPPESKEIKHKESLSKEAVKENLEKPYASDAQRRFFHSPGAKEAGISQKDVDKWDKESKGMKLPEKVDKQEPSPAPAPTAQMPAPKPPKFKDVYKKKIKLPSVHFKAEMPSGAAMPKKPSGPKPPKPAVGPSNQPAAAASKQAQASAKGQQAPAPKPSMSLPNIPSQHKKSEKSFYITETEIMTPCHHCGVPEFKKSEGKYKFQPCACFKSETISEDGKKKSFVDIIKDEDGQFKLKFDPKADPDSKKVFLLLMKSQLLVSKRLK